MDKLLRKALMAIGLMIVFGMTYMTYISADTRKVKADIEPTAIIRTLHSKYPPNTFNAITNIHWKASLYPSIHWFKSLGYADIISYHDSNRMEIAHLNVNSPRQKIAAHHFVLQSQLLFGLYTISNDESLLTVIPSELGTLAIMIQDKNQWTGIDDKVIYTFDKQYQLKHMKIWNALLYNGFIEAKVLHSRKLKENFTIHDRFLINRDTIQFEITSHAQL